MSVIDLGEVRLLRDALEDTLTLRAIADEIGVSFEQARALVRALVALPGGSGDRILERARVEHLALLARQRRSRR